MVKCEMKMDHSKPLNQSHLYINGQGPSGIQYNLVIGTMFVLGMGWAELGISCNPGAKAFPNYARVEMLRHMDKF